MTDIVLYFLSLVFFTFTVFNRNLFGSWLAPSPFFSLFWLIQSVFPLFVLPKDIVGISTFVFILYSSFCFFLGSVFVDRINLILPLRNQILSKTRRRNLMYIFILTVPCNLVLSILILYYKGHSIVDLLSIEKFIVVSASSAVGRYTETYIEPWYWKWFLIIFYLTPLLGGFLLSSSKLKINILIITCILLPALLITGILNQRGMTGFTIYFLFASYFTNLASQRKLKVFNVKSILAIFLLVLLVVFFLLISSLARIGSDSASDTNIVVGKVFAMLTSSVIVFSNWFEKVDISNLSFGLSSFPGIADQFGIRKRELGLYPEFVELSVGEESNLYTFFRPLVEDFGILGSGFVLFVLGYLFTYFFKRVYVGCGIGITITVFFYAFVFMSYITTIFVFNSLIASFFLFGLIIFLNRDQTY
jgi:oligosaccharide repeat unit polymerase